MSYFPESVRVEVYTVVDGLPTWTNIGGDIVSPIKVSLGFTDVGPLNRLAPGGDMRFDLNNINSTYDPSSTFYKGQKIRLRVKYGSLPQVKFFGYIDVITVDVGTWGSRQVHVTAIDWLGLAAKTPIRALPGLTNTTIDLAVASLLTQMQIQPESTDFEIGNITLPSVFDDVTENSTVYSELQNLVMAEWGYIYMRDGGQTLKVENSLSRNGDGSDYKSTAYYRNDGVEEVLFTEDSGPLLDEDGFAILLQGEPTAEAINSDLEESYTTLSIIHGDNLTNKIIASAVPVVIGGSTLVLYPFDIANGSEALLVPGNNGAAPYILQGQYKDPTAGGAQISGSSIVTPVLTTDWKFNSKADGTGTDLSGNITITFTAGVSGFKAIILNTGVPGYITKFNVRGIPVYRYAPIDTYIQDQRSIWDYGDYSLQFTRQYGANSDDIQPFLFRLLMRDRKPRTKYSNPKFNGFDTLNHLAVFLGLDIGDQIRLASTKPASDALYYIQGQRFAIKPGSEQVTFEYITEESNIATEIAIEQTLSTQSVDFGYLPIVSNLTYRSFCFRLYIASLSDVNGKKILGIGNNIDISLVSRTSGGTNYLGILFVSTFGTTSLIVDNANAANAVAFAAGWYNIVIRFTKALSGPVEMYVNNVAQVTGTVAGTGATLAEDGARLVLGNVFTDHYLSLAFIGKMENIAIYDRLINTTEISTIHNSGTRLPFASYPQTGLKFFFGGMDADDYTDKLDETLTSLDTVYDLQNGFSGQPLNSPTLRAVG